MLVGGNGMLFNTENTTEEKMFLRKDFDIYVSYYI